MRKYMSFITATALILSLTACSNKNKTDDPQPEIIEPVGDTVPEEAPNELHCYKDSDFTDITLNLSSSDEAPPVDIEYIDTENLDFGERQAPCCAEDVRMDYRHYFGGDPESEENVIKQYNMECDLPSKGEVEGAYYYDGKYYLMINYDIHYCGHCWSIFSYDPVTEELVEEYNMSSLEEPIYCSRFFIINGRIILSSFRYSDSVGSIYVINEDTGEPELLYSGDFGEAAPDENGMIKLSYYKWSENGYTADEIHVETLDPETCEIVSDETRDFSDIYGTTFIDGKYGILVVTEPKDGSRQIMFGNNVLDTQLKNINGIEFSDHCLSLLTSDKLLYTSSSTLYTYDFETKERYVMDFSGCGNYIEGNAEQIVGFSSGSSSGFDNPVFLIMPKIGTLFKLGGAELTRVYDTPDGTVIVYSSAQARNYTEDSVSYEPGYIPVKKLILVKG
ncbi:MAG: hypothetical protein IJ874_00525 [Ruminococcus sp.]|nr:hypothetical protein [Ruminococcus sp.]